MGFIRRNPPRSHAFAAAFEPRTAFATFSPSKSWRIELHMAVNNLFLPKTKKSAKHKVSFHFSIPKSGCIGLQVEVDYLF